MADETLHPKKARRYRELEILDQWMTAHGITDRNLRGRIVGIDVYLSRHDDREARLFTLNQLEQLFLFGGRRDEWAVTGLRAIALWRLYQQSLD